MPDAPGRARREGRYVPALRHGARAGGFRGRVLPIATHTLDLEDKIVRDVRVKAIVPQPVAGREQLVTFELADEKSGGRVEDLEPFLGAPAHLLIAQW